MRSAESMLREMVRHIRPPRGCAITLTERESRSPADPNWVAASGNRNAECTLRYTEKVAALSKSDPHIDWSGVKMKTGARRVALWLSEVDGELP